MFKIKNQLRVAIILLTSLFFSLNAFAKTLDLFEQPQAKSKIIGNIDPNSGFIPIFAPKDHPGWIKVADPKNGNVGWMQTDTIEKASTDKTTVTYTHSIAHGNDIPATYRLIQFAPNNLSAEENKALLKQIEKQKLMMHQSMENLFRDMDQLCSDSWHSFFMPLVILPKTPATQPTNNTNQTKPVEKTSNDSRKKQ